MAADVLRSKSEAGKLCELDKLLAQQTQFGGLVMQKDKRPKEQNNVYIYAHSSQHKVQGKIVVTIELQ